MSEKTIQKPLTCRNARCGASCSIVDAQFWSDNPQKCPYYEYNPYIYDKAHDEQIRADAIDDFYTKCREKYWFSSDFMNYFDEVREQLKESKNA